MIIASAEILACRYVPTFQILSVNTHTQNVAKMALFLLAIRCGMKSIIRNVNFRFCRVKNTIM